MYNITIHNTQHLCLVENVAKHSVRCNGVLHFDPVSLSLLVYARYNERTVGTTLSGKPQVLRIAL